MPDFFYLLSKWWKQILSVVVLCTLAAGSIVFIKQQKYLSVATAVAGNNIASDKSRIFSENIEALYSNLGSPDELDVIVGTGQLDTIYLAVTDQFNLFDHYKIKGTKEEKRLKSAHLLKCNTEIQKSEYGELKVKVWDIDRNLAPQLANALIEELGKIYQQLESISNQTSLNGLKSASEKIKTRLDSVHESDTGYKTFSDRLQQYEKLIDEYQLMVDTKPQPLVIVEQARPSLLPDKPKRLEIIIATFVLSFLFALSVALILEKRKKILK